VPDDELPSVPLTAVTVPGHRAEETMMAVKAGARGVRRADGQAWFKAAVGGGRSRTTPGTSATGDRAAEAARDDVDEPTGCPRWREGASWAHRDAPRDAIRRGVEGANG
jgi:hypothetical protein